MSPDGLLILKRAVVVAFTEDQVDQVAAISGEAGQSVAQAVVVAIANDTTVVTYPSNQS